MKSWPIREALETCTKTTMRAILLAAVVFSLTAPGISLSGSSTRARPAPADPVPAQARSGAQTGTKNTLGVFP